MTRPSHARDHVPAAGVRVEAHSHRTRYLAGDPACISVRATATGALTSYATYLVLDQVTFAVQASGHRRCLTEGVRNVHAWVRGDVAEASVAPVAGLVPPPGAIKVTYQPFLAAHFFVPGTTDDGTVVVGNKVTAASRVFMWGRDLYALDATLSAPEPLALADLASVRSSKKKAA